MTDITQPTILIIIGISGDLSRYKLLPALREIAKAQALPKSFRVIGVSRRDLNIADVVSDSDDFWEQHLEMHKLDLDARQAYHDFALQLEGVERSLGGSAQRLFYLSVPPEATQSVVEHLGESGLAGVKNTKLLLEKPFGVDLASAESLVKHTSKYFKEDQIYRIDHYLAKEMAQNLVVFRAANPFFAKAWNKEFVASIEIIASETIGIEGRKVFYEQTGALRDVVQSHLLQLLALTLMDLPKLDDWASIPGLRYQALEAIQPSQKAIRGQYKGYTDEVGNADSVVETFVSIDLASTDPRWQGVPIRLIAGKALKSQFTEIRLSFRGEGNTEANLLTLRIQPDERVQICIWVKKPGYQQELQQIPLSFTYKNNFNDKLPSAYERVFVDAMRSEHNLFTTSQEVLSSWRILAPTQSAWQGGSADLRHYDKGSSHHDVIRQVVS
ncbi:MAG: glucose-6-phosphate dehydrogenase [Candidatus Saccharimonadales bacterium]